MPLFAAKGMMSSGGGGNFYTIAESKRDTLDNSSYRQPTGMFDVATSSSGEVYTLNGERNILTGLYNAVIAKIGAIGAVSWQYTLSAAKNVYPCAFTCNTNDNSIFVCLMETTTENGANNYNMKRFNYANTGWNDSTNNAIYHFIKFSSSGTRVWENIWNSSNPVSYPAAINRISSTGSIQQANVFENRIESSSSFNMYQSGAPDLKITKTASHPGQTFSGTAPYLANTSVVEGPGSNALTTNIYRTLQTDFTGENSIEAFALDGPAFGGRPQSTSNIVIDYDNEQFYILVAGNATAGDLSQSRSTMQALQIPFSGVSIQAKELVYPGGWDQNAKITLDRAGDLIVPWTGTNKEENYLNLSYTPTYYNFFDTGHSANNIYTGNTATFLRIDWNNNDYDLTYYSKTDVAPCKICKVEPEPIAEGTLYEYVTSSGLTPTPGATLAGRTADRQNSSALVPVQLGRYSNFVQLHKKNVASNALDWVRTFFAIPRATTRDMNNFFNNGSVSDKIGGVHTADIHVADSKVFANGIYYIGNVVLPNEGPNIDVKATGVYDSTLSYIGFIAKVKFDGTVDYIREIRALKTIDNANTPTTKPKYLYEPQDDGGVLLDSINFDAFNNMIVTARNVSQQYQGTTGNYIDNVIFKLPHNGDLIGPILIDDAYNQVTKRFSYTPASTVRCWEEVTRDNGITNSGNIERYKLLRCCALWNTGSSNVDPTTLGGVSTQTAYNAWMAAGTRMVTLDTGTYSGRFLWQGPQTALQLDPTTNRQWDRANRRSSSSIFLQTYEESDSSSRIEAIKSCPGYVYANQEVNTDNAKVDFDVASALGVIPKSTAEGDILDAHEIEGQEHPNALVTISQYWDGDLGLRQQLLTRHSPTGGVEARLYDTGFNTYPKDVCVDEVGNIYTVGWTADTTGGNAFGCGYVTCYDKDLVYQWDYQYVITNAGALGDAAANFQIHSCAVTCDTANTAKLFVGGHYTNTTTGTNTQIAAISCIPLSLAGSGASTVVGVSVNNSTIQIGGAQSGNAIDGIFGLDVIQSESTDIYVGYAGNTYDTTGATVRGMYGVVEYNAATVQATTSDGWAYITGDDLRLSSFSFCKGVDGFIKGSTTDIGMKFAVGGDETQAGDTNGVVIIANVQRSGGTRTTNGAPVSTTQFVINNGNGADIVRDLRWGFAETPGIQKYTWNPGTSTRVDFRPSASIVDIDANNTFYTQGSYEDRLYVVASVTNQFSQVDTYVIEVTSASLPERTGGNYATPDAANLTRVGKISTSGITQPAGVCVLGPNYGTIMLSSTSANAGTPNDRQLLTAKVPLDMSKKNSAYTEVGSQFVYWDEPDFSLSITAKTIFAIELDQLNTSSYYDGSRFYWGLSGAIPGWSTYVGNVYSNVDNVGSFIVRTKDLQQFKQS